MNNYQELFNYLHDLGLIATESQMQEIIIICKKTISNHRAKLREMKLDRFNKVLELVNSGYTIQKALKKIGKNTTANFYKQISKEQKLDLQTARLFYRFNNPKN